MKKIGEISFSILCLCIMIFLMPVDVLASDELVKVSTEDELRSALESGKSVELVNDIIINSSSTKVSRNPAPGIAITGEGDITIEGNNYTISSSKVRTILEIYAIGEGANVIFKDVNISNSKALGRCIDTRTGNITLTLNGVNLTTTSTYNNQPLTVGGNYKEAIDIKVINSTISAGSAGYGVIAFNPVNLVVDNSEINGYGIFYLKGEDSSSQGSAGSVINVENSSNLIGRNIHDGETSNFGAIVFEDCGITVNIEDSTLEATSTGIATQVAVLQSVDNCQNNKVNINGKSTLVVDTKEKIFSGDSDAISIQDSVSIVEKFTIKIPTIVVAEKVSDVSLGVVENNTTEEILFNSLKSDKDITADIDDEKVKVEVEIAKVSETSIDDTVVENIKNKVNNATIAAFFDVTIAVKNSDNNQLIGTLDELNEEIELIILLPDELKNNNSNVNRTYYIIREHDDKVELLDATISEDGNYLVFKSHKFSTYALAYSDSSIDNNSSKVVNNPKTGDNITLYIVATGLALICMVIIALKIRKNKISSF